MIHCAGARGYGNVVELSVHNVTQGPHRSQQRQERKIAALLCCLPCDQQATINMYRRFMEVLNGIFLTYSRHLGVLLHSSEHSHPVLIHRMAYKIPKEIVELKA